MRLDLTKVRATMLLICNLKSRWLSIITPKSFMSLADAITLLPIRSARLLTLMLLLLLLFLDPLTHIVAHFLKNIFNCHVTDQQYKSSNLECSTDALLLEHKLVYSFRSSYLTEAMIVIQYLANVINKQHK